jgi:hypothetical protein
MSIQQLPQLPPYIKLCEVIIQYSDREETVETYLDLDRSVEDQVFESFNPLSSDYPQILSFKWRDLATPPCPRNSMGHYTPTQCATL